MRNDLETSQSLRAWHAMLASLWTCYSCGIALPATTAQADGFCRDCLARSRNSSDDHIGGEA